MQARYQKRYIVYVMELSLSPPRPSMRILCMSFRVKSQILSRGYDKRDCMSLLCRQELDSADTVKQCESDRAQPRDIYLTYF